MVEKDPLRKLIGTKKKKVLPVFVKEAEMNKLLDETEWSSEFKSSRDHLILELFYATGMRLSELIGLDDSDLDLELMMVRVTGKGNKQRLIPFAESLREEIIEYISIRDTEILRCSDSLFVGF